MLDTKKINEHIKNYENITKDYFTIDIDNLDWLQLTLIHAKILATFLPCDPKHYKKELTYNFLTRPVYSSTKTGVHFKVNVKNNLIENLYYRTYFGDDTHRLLNDIVRLNFENEGTPSYDIAFKVKKKNNVIYKKDFKIIFPFLELGMKVKTFYKLIGAYQKNDKLRVIRIMNHFKKINQFSILDELEQINFTENQILELEKIFKKYSDNGVIKNHLAYSKAIYRYISLNMRYKNHIKE